MMSSNGNSKIIKVELGVVLTNEDLSDIVCTALCGGVGYWACLDNTREEWNEFNSPEYKDLTTDEIATKILISGKSLYFFGTEEESETILELNMEKLINGIKRVLADDSTLVEDGRLDVYSIDACVADNIFQYAIFDELVYG